MSIETESDNNISRSIESKLKFKDLMSTDFSMNKEINGLLKKIVQITNK